MANNTSTRNKKSNTGGKKTSSAKSAASKTGKSSKTGSKASKSASAKKTNSKKASFQLTEEDTFFIKDSTRDIVLVSVITLCILLCLSNFGIGGPVGAAVAGALFGTFGIVQFILPLWLAAATFLIISNYGKKIVVAKIVMSFIMLIFISGFVELFIHGQEMTSAANAFTYASTNHIGGGYIGGGIVVFLYNSFDLFGAYLIDILVVVLSFTIITENFFFWRVQRSSRNHAKNQAMRNRKRREDRLRAQDLDSNGDSIQFNANRQEARRRAQESLQAQGETGPLTGPRRNHKRTGITTATDMLNETSQSGLSFDIGQGLDQGSIIPDVEVTKTTRHSLRANGSKSLSQENFKPEKEEVIEHELVIPQVEVEQPEIVNKAEPVSIPVAAPKINIPSEPEISRKAKPSVTNVSEMEAESQEINKNIASDSSKPKKEYQYPPLSLLKEQKSKGGDSREYLQEMAQKLQATLSNFGVDADVKEVTPGPSVTQFKISIPPGTKVTKVTGLTDDIKLSMAVTDVRIEAPIPGQPYIGIEVPNKVKTMVGFRDLAGSKEFLEAKSKVSFCVGKDISNQVIVGNIEKMPHLLIAGATGSGKSVCINTIIMSILYKAKPDEVKMIMVDPKMVELSVYNGIPHLLIPVVTDPKKAAGALHWAVQEMTTRYELLSRAGVRNIEGFNEKADQDALPEDFPADRRCRMPQIVIILDELADLMMVAASDVEDSIVRLAQLARAAGMHLIIATQRPTANVITGLIKANVPSRIAFSVSSGTDSRVILDMTGAEELLGNGDMLYAPQNLSKPIRLQGAFVSDEEVSKVVDFLKDNNDKHEYSNNIEAEIEKAQTSTGAVSITGEVDNSRDALYAEAGRLVIESQKGSIGYLQRNFRIGFNRAARIMDQLAEAGVVGPEVGTKPREIKMSLQEFEDSLNQ